jgi:glycosyltransferase involved in cell wall biosynthesis
MRIAQLCSVAHAVSPKAPHGIYNLVGNLCDSFVDHGYDVTLFSAGDATTKAKKACVSPQNAEALSLSEAQILRGNLETASLCFSQAEKFDIIHSHFSLLGCHFSPLSKTPTFHSIHSPITDELKPHLLHYKKEKFISFSLAQREQLPELNWVANIYHGIDTNVYTFNETPEEYVLYLGRITQEKGVHHAIAAAKEAGVQLIIAGVSYPSEGYWSKQIEPHIDGVQVRFLGPANMEQKIKLMQNAKALLLPTLAKETFGLVMIEAMSCGTPVIGFDAGAVSEVIQDGETGYVVKTEKQMAAAIKKIGKISRSATRKRAETYFSLERMTRGYERVYARYADKK